jgi:hypothetical protein
MNTHAARLATLLVLATVSGTLSAQTYVTTYVTKVQEERETTRWTLTEWLRIKERMRMMDVWLAMFSDPKRDQFRPELNLTYGLTRGAVSLTEESGAASTTDASSVTGTQGRAQVWLTNLISGTVGIRMLNIDLGGEVYQRASGGFTSAIAATGTDAVADDSRALEHTYYTGNLRLFGKNIQDSSLVLKYGEYQSENRIPQWVDVATESERRGKVGGAELQVYFLKWLGAEGNYLAYGDAKDFKGSDEIKGAYYDYSGFIEISLLRLMIGRYQEEWSFASLDGAKQVTEQGVTAGAKLSF